MKFQAEINVMPLKDLLDPQGKAVTNGLNNIGCTQINDVRVGKCITYTTVADSETAAFAEAEERSVAVDQEAMRGAVAMGDYSSSVRRVEREDGLRRPGTRRLRQPPQP